MQREDCNGGFPKKNEIEEIASLDMGVGTNTLPSIFSANLSKVYLKFLLLIYAISTLLFLVAGKASRIRIALNFQSNSIEATYI